jgi:thymidylate synthase ThyX
VASSAKIVLDSIGPNGVRLTTFELTYPRFIHSELMTHRMLSRNSASSRAIPVEKLLKRIEDDPALPVWWGKNQSGMQAAEELTGHELGNVQHAWHDLRFTVLQAVRRLGELGLHKQIANRPVEAWMPITVIVTATHWSNLRALRVSPQAQPEFNDVMKKAFALFDKSTPQVLAAGRWHLPYVTGFDETQFSGSDGATDTGLCMISAGRCAAVSYLNQDKRDVPADIERAHKLMGNGHMSPFEHIAKALTKDEWQAYALAVAGRWIHEGVPVGNLWGWKQFRKTIENEDDFSKIKKAGT